MWYPFSDFDRRSPWNDLFRSLERMSRGTAYQADFPVTLVEGKEYLELSLDLPGVAEQDLTIDIHDAQTITIQAKRTLPRREGYAAHRTERQPFEWKKSYTLPMKIDAALTQAKLDAGVLTVKLAKLPESQPRRIAINAA